MNEVAKEPKSYIMLPQEVKDLAHRGEKEGRISFWLQPSAYCIDDFYEAWRRIGAPNQSVKRAGQKPRR